LENARTAAEQKAEVEEQEQLAACPYCGDVGLQGLSCGVLVKMIYDVLVDAPYVVIEFHKDSDKDNADNEEELEQNWNKNHWKHWHRHQHIH